MNRLACAALALALFACSSDEEADYAELDNFDELAASDGKADGTTAWELLGRGVVYQHVNAGTGVLIAYGGYTARLTDTAAWATELVDAELGAAGVGHVFAVRGPADAAYAAREIANTKLRAKLATLDGASSIYVVAHSSGAFVAHELFGQLADDADTLARMSYSNLDGGGSGLTTPIVESLGKVQFVYALDPTLSRGLSKNSGTMMTLANAYAPHASAFEVRIPSTGCHSGAGWCLHDVVITHRPHVPTTFDVARDYTDFEGRPVTTEYLAPLL